jgi:hypothetical protein
MSARKSNNTREVPLRQTEMTHVVDTEGPKPTVTKLREVRTQVSGASGPQSFKDMSKDMLLGQLVPTWWACPLLRWESRVHSLFRLTCGELLTWIQGPA